MGPEIPDRLEPRAQPVLKRLDVLAEVRGLAVPPDQLGLEIEQVDVAGRPGHEELHHPPGLGSMVQAAIGAKPGNTASGIGRKQTVGPQQGRKRNPAQPAAALPQKLAPVHGLLREGETSIHKDEFVQIQDHPAGARQTVLAGMVGEGLLFRRGRQAAKGQPAGGGSLFGRPARPCHPRGKVPGHGQHEAVVIQRQGLQAASPSRSACPPASTGRRSRARP